MAGSTTSVLVVTAVRYTAALPIPTRDRVSFTESPRVTSIMRQGCTRTQGVVRSKRA